MVSSVVSLPKWSFQMNHRRYISNNSNTNTRSLRFTWHHCHHHAPTSTAATPTSPSALTPAVHQRHHRLQHHRPDTSACNSKVLRRHQHAPTTYTSAPSDTPLRLRTVLTATTDIPKGYTCITTTYTSSHIPIYSSSSPPHQQLRCQLHQ